MVAYDRIYKWNIRNISSATMYAFHMQTYRHRVWPGQPIFNRLDLNTVRNIFLQFMTATCAFFLHNLPPPRTYFFLKKKYPLKCLSAINIWRAPDGRLDQIHDVFHSPNLWQQLHSGRLMLSHIKLRWMCDTDFL